MDVAEDFPVECRYVLESLGEVYRVDAEAKDQALTPEQRWPSPNPQPACHGTAPGLDAANRSTASSSSRTLAWVRPSATCSGTGKPLTLFLRQAGAPLDNKICERALKMAILHRKNSLSYKTLNGARTGDLFMSLINTCQLNGVNPFDYLLAIATHPDAIKLVPKSWLPWNYPKSPASDSS